MSSNTLDPEIAAILAQLPTGPQGRISVADQRTRFAVFIDGFRKALQPQMPNGKVLLPYSLNSCH